MSELSYKELQEQGVFDVPYRAFKYMQSQQAKIDELQKQVITQGQNFNDQAQKLKDTEYFNQKLQARVDEALEYLNNLSWASELDVENVTRILKGNKDEN